MSDVILILPYYGKLPAYFEAFLGSLSGRNLDVLFVSDIAVTAPPANFHQLRMSFGELASRIRSRIGAWASVKSPYKLCDYKPLYGKIFEEYIQGYRYFAFGDCDVLYGTLLDEKLAALMAQGYDVISFRRHWISGGFCLMRNTSAVRDLALRARDVREKLSSAVCERFDELCGDWFADLKNGRMRMLDCERITDSFSAVVWRAADLSVYHDDILCESALKPGVIRMSAGDLTLDGERITAFHYICAKRNPAFLFGAKSIRVGETYRITSHGFYASEVGWRFRLIQKPLRICYCRFCSFIRRARTEGVIRTVFLKAFAVILPRRRCDPAVVGIRTIPKDYLLSNYGTFFQHYALRQVLRRMGYVSVRLPREESRLGCFEFIADDVRALLTCAKDVLMRRKPRAFAVCLRNWRRRRMFRSDYRHFIGPVCELGYEETCRTAIAGSDQVFSGYAGSNFLADLPSNVRRLSYAASADWEVARSNAAWCQAAADALSCFRRISVREDVGADLLHELVPEKRIAVTCDPVLLLTAADYEKDVCRQGRGLSDVLFCYLLNLTSDRDVDFNALRDYSRKRNIDLVVVAAPSSEKYVPGDLLRSPGPREFLALIANATAVVTNSFHGTLFSIIFRRDFLTLAQGEATRGQNVRIESLARKLGIAERCINAGDLSRGLGEILGRVPDWEEIHCRVREWSDESRAWLEAALRS